MDDAPEALAGWEVTIVSAPGLHSDRPQETVEYRAKLFLLTSGYTWNQHLLLNSPCSVPERNHEPGSASGKVHERPCFYSAFIELGDDLSQLESAIRAHFAPEFPLFTERALCEPRSSDLGSGQGSTAAEGWERPHPFGGDIARDGGRNKRGAVRVRAYYDVILRKTNWRWIRR
jgi:hypothetical protein